MKKMISLCLSLVMIFSLTAPAVAVENSVYSEAADNGHSSKSSAQIDISVSVDVFTGDITTTFSIAPSASGTVTPYGKKQILFYNDGTKYVEA